MVHAAKKVIIVGIHYEVCPNCGSGKTIKFVYGLPTYELFIEAEEGKVKLGGCVQFSEESPDYYCKDCHFEWTKQQVIDNTYNKIKKVKVSYGQVYKDFYQININMEDLQLSWEHLYEISLGEKTKPISKQTAGNFVQQLKRVHLLNWDTEYNQSAAEEGTQWHVEIVTDNDDTISKGGMNDFPEEWGMFRSIIEVMAGERFYND